MTNEDRIKLIGNRIKEARDMREMTLEDIANDVHLARSTIQRYENAKIISIKIPVIEAIAKSLHVDPVWLMGEDVPMIPKSDAEQFGEYITAFNKKRNDRIISLNLNDNELDMIIKFRSLDSFGKDVVTIILDKEHDRCKNETENTVHITREILESLPLKDRLPLLQYQDEEFELRVARKNRRESK